MALRGLPREKVLATVVHLLETTLIRVGNDDYAKAEQELRPDHACATRTSRWTARSCGSSSRARAARRGGCRSRIGASPRSSSAARICRARSCSSTSTRTASARTSTSADVNDYLQRDHRPRHHGQGFPHLGRHRAGGAGAAGVRDLRHRGRGQEEHARRHRAGAPRASATRPRSAANATSTRRS